LEKKNISTMPWGKVWTKPGNKKVRIKWGGLPTKRWSRAVERGRARKELWGRKREKRHGQRVKSAPQNAVSSDGKAADGRTNWTLRETVGGIKRGRENKKNPHRI